MADANKCGGIAMTSKRVQNINDMSLWQRSRAYHDLIGYINGTSTAIQGIKLTDEIHVSPVVHKLVALIDELQLLVEKNPPCDQPQRFGNKAYRDWSQQMRENLPELLRDAIPTTKHKYLLELQQYVIESFGNATRIDYGTGHELSFVFFLCALFKAEILQEQDIVSAALRLFNRYLVFVRNLQRTYNMEPAGSQGVWSLDDYQFVPFIWGSAQLSTKSPFDPAKFVDEQIINDYKEHFMFISCIDYICKVKTGHFGEHSNQLWSITAVPSWPKINAGLVKMYQKEILSKFPVIQHVYFSELMSFDTIAPGTALTNARLGYVVPPPPPPTKRICIVPTAATTTTAVLAPPTTVSAPPPQPATTGGDGVIVVPPPADIGDSSSEGSDNSVVMRPRSSSPASLVETEGSSLRTATSSDAETKQEAD